MCSLAACTEAVTAVWGKEPKLVSGPSGLARCHSKEEYRDLDELYTCAQIYQRLAESFCSQKK